MLGLLGKPSIGMTILVAIAITFLITPTTFSASNVAFAEPAVLLSPPEGPAGTMVRVDGFGFVPHSVVTISLNGGKMDTRPFAITANDAGEFDATFQVPHSIESGTYPVVADGHSLNRVSATSTFQVSGPNNPPVANSQSLSVDQSKEINIKLEGSDPDGDEITYSMVDEPQHGIVNGFDPSSGSLTYVPSRDYEGSDRFTFRTNDGKADSFLAEVSIRILESDGAPTMESMAVEMQEDMQLTILLRATNDDTSPLRFEIVNPPKYGTLGFIKPNDSTSASVTYAPNPNFNGTDFFTAKASDTRFESQIATIAILVTPVQDRPVANSGQIRTAQDAPIEIALTASDPDGDVLAYSLESRPSHGTLLGSGSSLRYVPSSDFLGWVSFTFKVNDGTVDSNTARIEIEITETAGSGDGVTGGDNGYGSTPSAAASGQDEPNAEVSETPDTQGSDVTPPPVDPEVSAPSTNEPVPAQTGSGDTVPPRIIFPAATQIFDSKSETGASAHYNIVAIDDTDGVITPECSPPSGANFPVGTVNVVCTATDSAGNTALGSFVVEVRLDGTQNTKMTSFPFDSFQFQIPEMQFAILPVIIAAVVGIGLAVGLKVARKTKTKSSQPQKSY